LTDGVNKVVDLAAQVVDVTIVVDGEIGFNLELSSFGDVVFAEESTMFRALAGSLKPYLPRGFNSDQETRLACINKWQMYPDEVGLKRHSDISDAKHHRTICRLDYLEFVAAEALEPIQPVVWGVFVAHIRPIGIENLAAPFGFAPWVIALAPKSLCDLLVSSLAKSAAVGEAYRDIFAGRKIALDLVAKCGLQAGGVIPDFLDEFSYCVLARCLLAD
jgi:hypothetical protein